MLGMVNVFQVNKGHVKMNQPFLLLLLLLMSLNSAVQVNLLESEAK